jgi:GH24 family phage-related lysozyme (muramidase)
MNANAFDAFTRRTAAAVSRRKSLLTIGGAALGATVAAPFVVEADLKKKECKKKCKKKCETQVEQCENEVRQLCNDLGAELEQECRDALLDCCSTLGKCKAAKSTECLLSNLVIVVNPA